MFTNLLSTEEVYKICENYFNSKPNENVESFTIVDYKLKAATDDILGFMGSHLSLIVFVLKNGSKIAEQKVFFIKSVPETGDEQLDYINASKAFEKETLIYDVFEPKARDSGITQWAPKCYYVRADNLLAMENLQDRNFRVCESHDLTLDLDHMLIALNCLAAMHATTFVLEKTHPDFMKRFVAEMLQENRMPHPKTGSARSKILLETIDISCEMMAEVAEVKENYEILRPKLKAQMMKIFDFCKPSTEFRNVVTHGDLWSSNIMFRYNDGKDMELQKPVEAILVDLQYVRWSPPALDVMALIYISTTTTFRQKYLHEMLNSYYERLRAELRPHDIDIEDKISRNEFARSCDYYALNGLIEVNMFSQHILLPLQYRNSVFDSPNDSNKRKEHICVTAVKEDDTFRFRVTDALLAFIETLS